MRRWGPTVGLLLAALVAVVVSSRSGAQADTVKALAWALLAAAGVSLLLRATGRRVVAVLAGLLSLGLAAAWWRGEGHWALAIAAVVGLAAAVAQFLWAPQVRGQASRYDRHAPRGRPVTDLDTWKAMDAGLDPTADGFGDTLGQRETAPEQPPGGNR